MEIFLDLFFYVKRFLIISWRKIRRISLNDWYHITKHLLFALIFLGVIIFNIQTTSGNITFAFEGSNHTYTTVENNDNRFELQGVSMLGDACKAGQESMAANGQIYDCVSWRPLTKTVEAINGELQYSLSSETKYRFERYVWNPNYVGQGTFNYYIEGTPMKTDETFESYYLKVDKGLTKQLYELFKIVPVWKQTGEFKYATEIKFDEDYSTNYFIVDGTVYKRFYETALNTTVNDNYYNFETVWEWPEDAYKPTDLYDAKFPDVLIGVYKDDQGTKKYETQYQYVLETRGTSYRTKDYAGRLPSDPNFDTSSYVYVHDDGAKAYYIYDGNGTNAKNAFARYDIDEEDGIWATIANKPSSSSDKNGEMPYYQYFVLDENTEQLVKKAYNYYQNVNEYFWYDNGDLWSDSNSLNSVPNTQNKEFYRTNNYYNNNTSSYEQDKITTYEYTLYYPNSSDTESYTELTGSFTDAWYSSCPTIKGIDCRPETQSTSEAMYRYGNVLNAETTYLTENYFYYPNNTTDLEGSMFAKASNETYSNSVYYGSYNTYDVTLKQNGKSYDKIPENTTSYNNYMNKLCSISKIFSDICYSSYNDSTMNIYSGTVSFNYNYVVLVQSKNDQNYKWLTNSLNTNDYNIDSSTFYNETTTNNKLSLNNNTYYNYEVNGTNYLTTNNPITGTGLLKYQKYYRAQWLETSQGYEERSVSNGYIDNSANKKYDTTKTQDILVTRNYTAHASSNEYYEDSKSTTSVTDASQGKKETRYESYYTARNFVRSKICKLGLSTSGKWFGDSKTTVYALCSQVYYYLDKGYISLNTRPDKMTSSGYYWNNLFSTNESGKNTYSNYTTYNSSGTYHWNGKSENCGFLNLSTCWYQLVSIEQTNDYPSNINSYTSVQSLKDTCTARTGSYSTHFTYYGSQYQNWKYGCFSASNSGTSYNSSLADGIRNKAIDNVLYKSEYGTFDYADWWFGAPYDFDKNNYSTMTYLGDDLRFYKHYYRTYSYNLSESGTQIGGDYTSRTGISPTFNPSDETYTIYDIVRGQKVYYHQYTLTFDDNGAIEDQSKKIYYYPDKTLHYSENVITYNSCANFELSDGISGGYCYNPYASDRYSTNNTNYYKQTIGDSDIIVSSGYSNSGITYYKYDLYEKKQKSMSLALYNNIYNLSSIKDTSVGDSGYSKKKIIETFGLQGNIQSVSFSNNVSTIKIGTTDVKVQWKVESKYYKFFEYYPYATFNNSVTQPDNSLVKYTFDNSAQKNGVTYYPEPINHDGESNGLSDSPIINTNACRYVSGDGVNVKYNCNSQKAIYHKDHDGSNYYKYYYYAKETTKVNGGQNIYYPYPSTEISGYTLTQISGNNYKVTVLFKNGYKQDKTNCYFDKNKNDVICNTENITFNTPHALQTTDVSFVNPSETDLAGYANIKTNILFSGKNSTREANYNYYKTNNTIITYLKQTQKGYLYHRASTDLCYSSMADAQNNVNGFSCDPKISKAKVFIDGALRDVSMLDETTLKNASLNVTESIAVMSSCNADKSVCTKLDGTTWYRSDSDGKYYSQYYYPATANYVALLTNNNYENNYYWHQYSRGQKTVSTGVVKTYDSTFKAKVNGKINDYSYFANENLEKIDEERPDDENKDVNANYNLFNITNNFTLNGITSGINSSVTSAGIYVYSTNGEQTSSYIQSGSLGLTNGEKYVVSLNGYFNGENAYLVINGEEVAIPRNKGIVSIAFKSIGNDNLSIRLGGTNTTVYVEWMQVTAGDNTNNVVYYPNANLIASKLNYTSSIASLDWRTYKYFFNKYNLNLSTWYKQDVTLSDNPQYNFDKDSDNVAGFWGNSIFGNPSPSLSKIDFELENIDLTKLAKLGVPSYSYQGNVCSTDNCRLTLTNNYRFGYHFYHYDVNTVLSKKDDYFNLEDENLYAITYEDVTKLFKDVDHTNEAYKQTGYTAENGVTYAYSEKMNKFYAVANYGDELTKWWSGDTSTDYQTLEAFGYYLENYNRNTTLYYHSKTQRFYTISNPEINYYRYEKYLLTTREEKITFNSENDFSIFKNNYISEKSNIIPIFTEYNTNITGENIYYNNDNSITITFDKKKKNKLSLKLIDNKSKNILGNEYSYSFDGLLNKTQISFQVLETGAYNFVLLIDDSEFSFNLYNDSAKNTFTLSFDTKENENSITLYNLVLSSSNIVTTEYVSKNDVSVNYNNEYLSQLFTKVVGQEQSDIFKLFSYGDTSITINGRVYDYKYTSFILKTLENSPIYNQYEYYYDEGKYARSSLSVSESLKGANWGLKKDEGNDFYYYTDKSLVIDYPYNSSVLYNNVDDKSPLYQKKNPYTNEIYEKTSEIYGKYVLKKKDTKQLVLNNIYNYDIVDKSNAFVTLDLQSAKVNDADNYLNTAYDNVLKFYNATSQMRNYAVKLSPINSLIKSVDKNKHMFNWFDHKTWQTIDGLYNREGISLSLITGDVADNDIDIYEHIMVNKGLTSYKYNNVLYYGFDCRSTSTCDYMDDDQYSKTETDYVGFVYDNYTLYSIYNMNTLSSFDFYDLIDEARLYMEEYFNLLIQKDSSEYKELSFHGRTYNSERNDNRYYSEDDFEKALLNANKILSDRDLYRAFNERIVTRMGNNKLMYLFTQTYGSNETPLIVQLFNSSMVSWYLNQEGFVDNNWADETLVNFYVAVQYLTVGDLAEGYNGSDTSYKLMFELVYNALNNKAFAQFYNQHYGNLGQDTSIVDIYKAMREYMITSGNDEYYILQKGNTLLIYIKDPEPFYENISLFTSDGGVPKKNTYNSLGKEWGNSWISTNVGYLNINNELAEPIPAVYLGGSIPHYYYENDGSYKLSEHIISYIAYAGVTSGVQWTKGGSTDRTYTSEDLAADYFTYNGTFKASDQLSCRFDTLTYEGILQLPIAAKNCGLSGTYFEELMINYSNYIESRIGFSDALITEFETFMAGLGGSAVGGAGSFIGNIVNDSIAGGSLDMEGFENYWSEYSAQNSEQLFKDSEHLKDMFAESWLAETMLLTNVVSGLFTLSEQRATFGYQMTDGAINSMINVYLNSNALGARKEAFGAVMGLLSALNEGAYTVSSYLGGYIKSGGIYAMCNITKFFTFGTHSCHEEITYKTLFYTHRIANRVKFATFNPDKINGSETHNSFILEESAQTHYFNTNAFRYVSKLNITETAKPKLIRYVMKTPVAFQNDSRLQVSQSFDNWIGYANSDFTKTFDYIHTYAANNKNTNDGYNDCDGLFVYIPETLQTSKQVGNYYKVEKDGKVYIQMANIYYGGDPYPSDLVFVSSEQFHDAIMDFYTGFTDTFHIDDDLSRFLKGTANYNDYRLTFSFEKSYFENNKDLIMEDIEKFAGETVSVNENGQEVNKGFFEESTTNTEITIDNLTVVLSDQNELNKESESYKELQLGKVSVTAYFVTNKSDETAKAKKEIMEKYNIEEDKIFIPTTEDAYNKMEEFLKNSNNGVQLDGEVRFFVIIDNTNSSTAQLSNDILEKYRTLDLKFIEQTAYNLSSQISLTKLALQGVYNYVENDGLTLNMFTVTLGDIEREFVVGNAYSIASNDKQVNLISPLTFNDNNIYGYNYLKAEDSDDSEDKTSFELKISNINLNLNNNIGSGLSSYNSISDYYIDGRKYSELSEDEVQTKPNYYVDALGYLYILKGYSWYAYTLRDDINKTVLPSRSGEPNDTSHLSILSYETNGSILYIWDKEDNKYYGYPYTVNLDSKEENPYWKPVTILDVLDADDFTFIQNVEYSLYYHIEDDENCLLGYLKTGNAGNYLCYFNSGLNFRDIEQYKYFEQLTNDTSYNELLSIESHKLWNYTNSFAIESENGSIALKFDDPIYTNNLPAGQKIALSLRLRYINGKTSSNYTYTFTTSDDLVKNPYGTIFEEAFNAGSFANANTGLTKQFTSSSSYNNYMTDDKGQVLDFVQNKKWMSENISAKYKEYLFTVMSNAEDGCSLKFNNDPLAIKECKSIPMKFHAKRHKDSEKVIGAKISFYDEYNVPVIFDGTELTFTDDLLNRNTAYNVTTKKDTNFRINNNTLYIENVDEVFGSHYRSFSEYNSISNLVEDYILKYGGNNFFNIIIDSMTENLYSKIGKKIKITYQLYYRSTNELIYLDYNLNGKYDEVKPDFKAYTYSQNEATSEFFRLIDNIPAHYTQHDVDLSTLRMVKYDKSSGEYIIVPYEDSSNPIIIG